jgi:O-methyltransferase
MNIIYESLKKIKFLRKIVHKIRYSKEEKQKIKSLKFQTDRRVYKSILLFDLCNKSPKDGVIVECGVGKGSSLSVLSNISNKKIFAFDSYEGFPEEISKYDHKDLLTVLKFSKWHYKMMTIERVKENLLNNAFDKSGIEKKIIFKKGFFPESFKNFNEEISFLHLDVDLYKSYKDCLEFFFPKVKVGGIITFDEYYEEISDNNKKGWDWRGANVAIDEFVKENDLELIRHFTGYRYVIKNK